MEKSKITEWTRYGDPITSDFNGFRLFTPETKNYTQRHKTIKYTSK